MQEKRELLDWAALQQEKERYSALHEKEQAMAREQQALAEKEHLLQKLRDAGLEP